METQIDPANAQAFAEHDADAHEVHDEHHAVSLWVLFAVFGALMVLTVLTVAAINVDLGGLNIAIALGLAFLKAVLVCLFFMHLWWDRPVHGFILLASLGFVALFIIWASIDTEQYGDRVAAADQAEAAALLANE
jgi:cytochrome c oxidase subunit 4